MFKQNKLYQFLLTKFYFLRKGNVPLTFRQNFDENLSGNKYNILVSIGLRAKLSFAPTCWLLLIFRNFCLQNQQLRVEDSNLFKPSFQSLNTLLGHPHHAGITCIVNISLYQGVCVFWREPLSFLDRPSNYVFSYCTEPNPPQPTSTAYICQMKSVHEFLHTLSTGQQKI